VWERKLREREGNYYVLDDVDGVLDHGREVEARRRGREGLPKEAGEVLLSVGFEDGRIFTPMVAPSAEVESGVPRLLGSHLGGVMLRMLIENVGMSYRCLMMLVCDLKCGCGWMLEDSYRYKDIEVVDKERERRSNGGRRLFI
jgi:hypothetical protein